MTGRYPTELRGQPLTEQGFLAEVEKQKARVPTPGVHWSTAARGPLEDMAAGLEQDARWLAMRHRTVLTPAEYQMLARYECNMLRKRESLQAPVGLNRRDRRAWLKRNRGSHV